MIHYLYKMKYDELWKPVNNYDGIYEVSSLGRVRSVSRKDKKGCRVSGKILSQREAVSRGGYMLIDLRKDGIKNTFRVHRLVADAFVLGRTKENKCVNHLDGDKKNNCFYNLEWCTHSRNTNHGIDLGLIKIDGENNYKSRFTNQQIRIFKWSIKFGAKRSSLGIIFNMTPQNTYDIVNEISWSRVKI